MLWTSFQLGRLAFWHLICAQIHLPRTTHKQTDTPTSPQTPHTPQTSAHCLEQQLCKPPVAAVNVKYSGVVWHKLSRSSNTL